MTFAFLFSGTKHEEGDVAHNEDQGFILIKLRKVTSEALFKAIGPWRISRS